MPVWCDDRKVYVNTEDTQSVKICTQDNTQGEYEEYWRIEPPYVKLTTPEMHDAIRQFEVVPALSYWLKNTWHARREPDKEKRKTSSRSGTPRTIAHKTPPGMRSETPREYLSDRYGMSNDRDSDQDFDFEPTIGGGEDDLLAGRYRVVRPLGEGGMGTVYLAEDEKLDGLPMAIKMLPSYLVRNHRAMDKLKHEARIAMGLTHSNIVTLRTFEDTPEGVFLVMDYVKGETLDNLLAQKGTFSEGEVVKLFMPIAEALDYAHSQNVIHRDIKPSNILIAKDGTPRITDFGVACDVNGTAGAADMSGTLSYMSPEQLRGDDPTPRQDIYSLAATMYECICGHPPFRRGHIRHQILNETPRPPIGSDSALEKVIMRCLAKTPEERPGSCRAIVEVIRSKGIARPSPAKVKASSDTFGPLQSAVDTATSSPEGVSLSFTVRANAENGTLLDDAKVSLLYQALSPTPEVVIESATTGWTVTEMR
jgi:serine/threonine-protein kinase